MVLNNKFQFGVKCLTNIIKSDDLCIDKLLSQKTSRKTIPLVFHVVDVSGNKGPFN